ncbi:MAG: serine--tRNA ligase, partial [Enterococcus thailandicus]|nr:serine--tRNA ligase [Enterococcus thailandicus]
MLDVKMMRQNFDSVQEKLMTRGVKKETLAEFMELDESRRNLLVKSEELKKYRNDVSAEIAQLKRNKEDASAKISEMKEVGGNIKALDTEIADVDEKLTQIATTLPNLPNDSVPIGKDEDDNVEVRRWSNPRNFSFEPKPHWELAENLD